MTVSTTTNRVSYACDGTTVVFPYTFKIFEDTDLEVILRNNSTGAETTLALTTDYTVSGAGEDSGGNVTTVSAYSSDYTLVIRRVLPLTQETDYITGDSFPADSHESALDRLVMIAQQLYEELGRAIKLAVTSPFSELEIPDPEANQYLKWNSSADALENADLVAYADLNAHDNAATPHQSGGWYASNTVTGPVLLATTAEVATGSDENKVVTPAGLKSLLGFETAFIPMGAFMELASNTATVNNQTYPAAGVSIDYGYFSPGGDWCGLEVRVGLPNQWDQETLKAKVEWMPDYGTAITAGSAVQFGLQARPMLSGVSFDSNLSTPPAYVTDTAINEATATEHRTKATGNFATAPPGSGENTLQIRLTRDNTISNNATAPVWVTGVWLQYRINQEGRGW